MLMKTSPETLLQLEYPEFYHLVQAGIKKLDHELPHWDQKIDINSLCLESPCNCILGQLYGSYTQGIYKANIDFGSKYGFSALIRWEFPILQKIWIREILKRREMRNRRSAPC